MGMIHDKRKLKKKMFFSYFSASYAASTCLIGAISICTDNICSMD